MALLDIRKALEKRRRKRVEINRSMVSSIQYQADVRRQMDRDIMRAEHTRLKGLLSRLGVSNPHIMRDRYEQLTAALRAAT